MHFKSAATPFPLCTKLATNSQSVNYGGSKDTDPLLGKTTRANHPCHPHGAKKKKCWEDEFTAYRSFCKDVVLWSNVL